MRDWLGRLVSRGLLRREHSAPRASGQRSVQRQHIRVLEPETLARVLAESEIPGYGRAEGYLDLAEQMEESYLHYAGVLSTRKRQIAQIPIRIEPVSDSPEDVADADLVRPFFERAEFEAELVDILDSLGKSFSASEIIWETSERQWMPLRLVHRAPQWFDFDPETGRRLMLHEIGEDGGWVELPAWKYVTHYGQVKSGLPIRGGLARAAAWSWMAHSFTVANWLRFCEVYGQPLRVGRYDASVSDGDRDVLRRALYGLSSDFAALIGSGMEIELLADSQATARSDIYRDLVSYLDGQISIHVLGQTLTTDAGDSGSYALGQVHNQVREDIERSDAHLLTTTLRRDLIVPVITLNRGEREEYPRVVIEREQATDAKMICDALAALLPHGLRVRADDVRQILDMETPGPDDEVLEMKSVSMPPPPDAPGRNAAMARLALLAADAGGAADPVSRAIAEHVDPEWAALSAPLVDPILAAAVEAGDYDRLRDSLPALFGEMNDSAIRRLLERLGFSGHVSAAGLPGP